MNQRSRPSGQGRSSGNHKSTRGSKRSRLKPHIPQGLRRARKKVEQKTRKQSSSSSSFKVPVASRSAIVTQSSDSSLVVGWPYLFALIGVAVLVLLGGGRSVSAAGLALLMPGLALLLRPPQRRLSKPIDFGILLILGSFVLSFLPVFYWKVPTWRTEAIETYGIDMPTVLSLQPLVSVEAFVIGLAAISWFYVLPSWPMNRCGRRWFGSVVSILTLFLAGASVCGNLLGWRYPGAEDAAAFSFFPDYKQMVNLLVIGGVASFGFAMEGVRRRRPLDLLGFVASALSLFALVQGMSRVGVLLYVCLLYTSDAADE